ncbi:hypothetical protein FA13DRAFT_1810349 [Coprinellus micaceus]|uniref:Arrestin-like N-terminal domain-containing protein n=1 Tax=Coprinellus micaceus TaxID=71717 RepID=A0A4Y7TT00_COPMI|nr:hypothetical protein FA13DRAFT_1810349 [Coprinellus micaceus]
MSSWRFRRSSTQSLPEASHPSSRQPPSEVNIDPPRYSNLISLEESRVTTFSQPAVSPDPVGPAEWMPSTRLSVMSWGSQHSESPSYRTHDPETQSISYSMRSLANPPRYSVLSHNSRTVAREGANVARRAVSSSAYAFDAMGGIKSERWATLRLYDERSTASRGAKKGRHPRFSNMDTMLGSVDLHPPSPQTIRSIELTLQGSIVTGVLEDGGLIKILEQRYTIWDRKFGDPGLLAHDQAQAAAKYNGKLSGNWAFPFSIPFPTRVDLSTLRAVYPRENEGPVRFLPELLREVSLLTPFDLGGDPTGIQPVLDSAPVGPSNIAPFDIRSPHALIEKGRLVSPQAEAPSQVSTPHFALIPSSSPTAPTIPSIEPFVQQRSEGSNVAEKPGRSPPPQHTSATGHQRPRGPTSMQDPELPISTTGRPLPQSFLERDVMVNVQYEMTLTITHGRFSTKSRVSTPVIYAPITMPPPMTLGRQRAYRRRETPPSPDVEPDGWTQLAPVSIRGTYNDQTTVAVKYTLSLATPLSYTRVIPLYLTVSCDDVNTLNLLADPRTPRVRLRRSTRFLHNQAELAELTDGPNWEDAFSGLGGRHRLVRTSRRLTQHKKDNQTNSRQAVRGPTDDIEPFVLTADREAEEEEETLGLADEGDGQFIGDKAVWCTPAHFTQEPRVRRLYGEIHLPRRLQPTCKFPLFNILYHVELLAPATNAFVPAAQPESGSALSRKGKSPATNSEKRKVEERVYLSHSVEIATNSRQDEPTAIPFVWVADSN